VAGWDILEGSGLGKNTQQKIQCIDFAIKVVRGALLKIIEKMGTELWG